MGLSKDIKDKLEARLDYDREGKLKAVVTKAETIKAPILIVGLGGTGVDAVLRTKKIINTRINCRSANGEWKEKPDNVEYLAIDTDDANENAEYEGMRFNTELEELSLFQNKDIGTILRNRKTYLMDDAGEWLSEELPISSVLHGAGGVRQAGRLMLFLNSNTIIEAIRKKISRVTKGYGANIPISVFILSGICGGTGSGTFIDIPYIIRKIAKEDNRKVENIGILFLPDVSLVNIGIGNDVIASNIRRNGFAALKELDFLMNMEYSRDTFEQGYGNNFKVTKTNEGPFDICLFISSRDSEGTCFSDTPYEYAISIAAETVVNFIAYEKADNGGKFTINSFISNIETNRTSFINSLGTAKQPVNYIYNVVGASTAFLPIDDLMSYMTCLMFEEVDRLYKNDPTEKDVEDMVKILNLDEGTVEREFRRPIPARSNFVIFTFDKIKEAPSALDTEYKGITKKQMEFLDDLLEAKKRNFELILQDKNNIINTTFKDLKKGPIYTQRLLYHVSDNLSVSAFLETARLRMPGKKFDAMQLDRYEKEMKNALNALANKGLFQKKLKLRNKYIQACDKYYNAILSNYVFDCIAKYYSSVEKQIIDINNEIYSTIAELLATLKRLFKKYGNINTATDIRTAGNSTILSWYLVSAPDFIQELTERMQSNPQLKVDTLEIVKEFYQHLLDHTGLWAGKSKGDVVDSINEFISDSFENILNKGMDYYMDFIAQKSGKTQSELYNDILQELNNKAKVMFPTKSEVGGTPVIAPRYSVLSVPENAPQMLIAANSYMSGKKSQVKKSGISERIFMLNFDIAVPLYHYAELDLCENAYEASIITNGVHLYEKNKNWKNLPSPNFETTWTVGHKNPRESRINREYRAIFEKAKEFNYLIYEPNISTYVCRYGNTIDYQSILEEFGIDLADDFNDTIKVSKCLNKLKESLKNNNRLTYSFRLYDASFMEDGITPNDQYAMCIFTKMTDIRENITKMVANHQDCLSVIEKLNKFEGITLLIRQYIRCIYAGCIFKNGSKYMGRDKMEKKLYDFHGTEDEYMEFYTFYAFFNLEDSEREDLIKRALKIKDSSGEDAKKKRKEILEQFTLRMKEHVNELNENWSNVKQQGKEKHQFYIILAEEAKNELRGFNDIY